MSHDPVALRLEMLRLRGQADRAEVLAAVADVRLGVAPIVRAVRVVQGAVTIETTGRALADARLGEVTRVRNTSTNESYAARVVGDGVVLVSAR